MSMEDEREPREFSKRATANALQHVLGNTCRLVTTCTSFRWNVSGPHAIEVAQVIGEQCAEMNDGRERLAARILALGHPAIASFADEVVVPLANADRPVPPARQLVLLLRDGHEAMRCALKATHDIAVDGDDPATAVLLAERLLAHENHAAALSRILPLS